ncbi:hypothetical protein BC833DRAFT_581795 [Globomyces pollinis-pini]|nr:hypothetical protein BC833DRAFT_581795 [Globomyces pollinis-pini]
MAPANYDCIYIRQVLFPSLKFSDPRITDINCCTYNPSIINCIEDRVIQIQLYKRNLTGSIPGTIDRLKSLQYLSLGGNSLSGVVPASLGNITTLTSLFLYDNFFNGTIPSTLADLPRLTGLELSGNKMSGPIPMTLVNRTFTSERINPLNSIRNICPFDSQFCLDDKIEVPNCKEVVFPKCTNDSNLLLTISIVVAIVVIIILNCLAVFMYFRHYNTSDFNFIAKNKSKKRTVPLASKSTSSLVSKRSTVGSTSPIISRSSTIRSSKPLEPKESLQDITKPEQLVIASNQSALNRSLSSASTMNRIDTPVTANDLDIDEQHVMEFYKIMKSSASIKSKSSIGNLEYVA